MYNYKIDKINSFSLSKLFVDSLCGICLEITRFLIMIIDSIRRTWIGQFVNSLVSFVTVLVLSFYPEVIKCYVYFK